MSTEATLPETPATDGAAPELGPQHFQPKDFSDPVFPSGRWLRAKLVKFQFERNKDDSKYDPGKRVVRIEYQITGTENPDLEGLLFRPFPMLTEHGEMGAPFQWANWCKGVGYNLREQFTVDPMDWFGRDVEVMLDEIEVGKGDTKRKANRLNSVRQVVG